MNILNSTQMKTLLDEGAQLVDVRSAEEYGRGAAPGAKNVPLHIIPHVAHEHLDMAKPVVLYCMSGGRSAQAQMILQSLGFGSVHNAGGLNNVLSA